MALAFLALFSILAAVLVAALPSRVALALTAAVLIAEAGLIGLIALRVYLKVRRSDVRKLEQAPRAWPGRGADARLTDEQARILKNWRARLFGGFSATALKELRPVVTSSTASSAYRLAVAEMVVDWYGESENRVEGPTRHFDIVITSHFALPGGTTSANAEEIRAYRKAGLRVGLLHHPVYHWDVARPIDQKIADLIDGEQVCLLDATDDVHCDLMIVRFPPAVMRLLDDRPRITAERTVLVVNQTPYSFYGPEGGTSVAWDVRTVYENLTEWVGEHTWYVIGPVVRDALQQHHAEEIARVDIADEFWYESIDAAEWRRPGQREREGGPFRIGRHSRDARLKWPDTAELVRACYPVDDADYEMRILGGAEIPKQILGGLPANWVDYPFNSMPSREFLADVDAMVYFISSEGAEAFGRAPLEAMAVGLPCVMEHRFEELFGEAAIYCSPEEVKGVLDRLRTDPAYYAEQAERAVRYVSEYFSHEAQLARVAALGVSRLREPAGDVAVA
jgi:glycosyltransferase involved in cell wall biosynthesis